MPNNTVNHCCIVTFDELENVERYQLPTEAHCQHWACAVLESEGRLFQSSEPCFSLSFIDEQDITALNDQYRGKRRPTNVLSFPVEPFLQQQTRWLGDVIVCPQVVEQEAQSFGLATQTRYAHMIIHGILHLLGYDHQQLKDRTQMEAKECDMMQTLGMPNPYFSS